jgi:hypothetical protein
MSQSFTFIDVAGNFAQYTVYERDYHDEFRWSTEHGDHGAEPTFEQAQYRARTVLKGTMESARRSAEATSTRMHPMRWR